MKDKLNKPCQECPFKREGNLAGWTGNYTATEFIDKVQAQAPMECHMTVDYSAPDWREQMESDSASYCAGAAHFLANDMSLPRDPEWGAVVRRLGESPAVFGDRGQLNGRSQFLARHDNDLNAYIVAEANAKRTGYGPGEKSRA